VTHNGKQVRYKLNIFNILFSDSKPILISYSFKTVGAHSNVAHNSGLYLYSNCIQLLQKVLCARRRRSGRPKVS
jgi:hypothetical protein